MTAEKPGSCLGQIADLEEFARSGQFGPLSLGMRRGDVSAFLGPPTDWLDGKPVGRSAIWKYGDVELYFDDEDGLYMIHFDSFDAPVGGASLQLSPWVVRGGLPLQQLEHALSSSGIPFVTAADTSNLDCVRVATPVGVSFLVQVEGDADELGLCQFGLSAA